MSRRLLFIAAGFLLIFITLASVYSWYSYSLRSVGSSTLEQDFVLAPDQSVTVILTRLQSAGLLRSPAAAKVYLRLSGLDRRLMPGLHRLSPSLSAVDLFNRLSTAPADIWVTFPEGWRREQYAARLATVLTGAGTKYNSEDFLKLSATLEGQLFPDTYLIPRAATAREMVDQLTTNFQAKTAGISLTPQQLIVASLVEREVSHPADRPLVAGIIFKRLQAGWPLQIDATVQYAQATQRCQSNFLTCDWWQPVITTQFQSAFNTYLSPGLPPAPIANPGLSAIQATVSPQDSAYWYYLSDSDGVTHYSVTLQEHNLAVDKYLKP